MTMEYRTRLSVRLSWRLDLLFVKYSIVASGHRYPGHPTRDRGASGDWSYKKYYSWEFTQHVRGEWMSSEDISELARDYARQAMCRELRKRATAFHALDLCRSYGICVKVTSLPFGDNSDVRERLYLSETCRRRPGNTLHHPGVLPATRDAPCPVAYT